MAKKKATPSSKNKEYNMHLARVLCVIASPFLLIGFILKLFMTYTDGKLTPGDVLIPLFFAAVLGVLYYLISGKKPPSWLGFPDK